jgi:saccharopine dehydrogenase (NADP+, L-glutamate forming)
VLVNLGFLCEDSVDILAPSASPITWNKVLQQITGAPSDSESDLIEACISKGRIPTDFETKRQIISGLRWLGLFSSTPVKNKGNYLDTLCATLEWKDGSKETRTSTGLWFGVPNGDSAMATTVGVPCAITAQLILDGVIKERGVLAPMKMELCTPILNELEKLGIFMVEATI